MKWTIPHCGALPLSAGHANLTAKAAHSSYKSSQKYSIEHDIRTLAVSFQYPNNRYGHADDWCTWLLGQDGAILKVTDDEHLRYTMGLYYR